MFISTMKNANLALSFFIELASLASFGYFGFVIGPNTFLKWILGIGLPVLGIVVWAFLGAPNSATRLQGLWLLLLEIVFFGLGALALYISNQHILGIVFALIIVINLVLVYVWSQQLVN